MSKESTSIHDLEDYKKDREDEKRRKICTISASKIAVWVSVM